MQGTIIGVREFGGKSKNTGKAFKGFGLCIRRSKDCVQDGFKGVQVDSFDVFEQQMGSFSPQVGDGVRYALYFQDGRQRCGFVCPDPEFDEGEG